MKTQARSALALVGGTLARAIDPRWSAAPPALPDDDPWNPLGDPRPAVWIAGNEWLKRDAAKLRCKMERLCARHGLRCLWPPQHYLVLPEGLDDDRRRAVKMFGRATITKMAYARAVIADFTPLRGQSLNPVVAFEMGIAAAFLLPIFAWTASIFPVHPLFDFDGEGDMLRRTTDRIWCGDHVSSDGYWRDETGLLVENFELVECAPIACAAASVSPAIKKAVVRCARYLAQADKAETLAAGS